MKVADDQIFVVLEILLKLFEQLVTVAYLKKQLTEVHVEKSVLKIFTNFAGKHQSWSLSLIKLQD